MGVLRLREHCNCEKLPDRAERLLAETRVRAVVQPAIRQMLKVGFDFVTFTSGTARMRPRFETCDQSVAGFHSTPARMPTPVAVCRP